MHLYHSSQINPGHCSSFVVTIRTVWEGKLIFVVVHSLNLISWQVYRMQSTLSEPGPETLNPVPVNTANSLNFDFTSNTNTNTKHGNTSTNIFDFSTPSGTDADLEALLKMRDMSLDNKAMPITNTPAVDTSVKKSKKKIDQSQGEYATCPSPPRPSSALTNSSGGHVQGTLFGARSRARHRADRTYCEREAPIASIRTRRGTLATGKQEGYAEYRR